jgi:hypothetical protein
MGLKVALSSKLSALIGCSRPFDLPVAQRTASWMLAAASCRRDAGGDHLIDRRAGRVAAAGVLLGRAGQQGDDARLVLLADRALHVQAVDHQQPALHRRERLAGSGPG